MAKVAAGGTPPLSLAARVIALESAARQAAATLDGKADAGTLHAAVGRLEELQEQVGWEVGVLWCRDASGIMLFG